MNSENQPKFNTRSDAEALANTIIKIKEIFDEEGLFFWLTWGGLLGIIRDGKLIPWNNDLEVCSWYQDISNEQIIKIVDQINKLGFTCIYYESVGVINIKKGNLVDININFCWVNGDRVIRPHVTASKYNREGKKNYIAFIFYWLSTSIFIYPNTFRKFRFSEENRLPNFQNIAKFLVAWLCRIFPLKMKMTIFKFLIYLSKKFGGKFQQTSIPLSLYSKFKLHPFYNSNMYVPHDPERVIEFIYGSEWRIPQDEWRWYDEKNKSVTGFEIVDEQFNYDHCGLRK